MTDHTTETSLTPSYFVFIRHGEALDTAGRCIGHTDVPLSPQGSVMIQNLAESLVPVISSFRKSHPLNIRLVSSDLRRAVESAAILSSILEIPTVEQDSQLREMHFGVWDGHLWSEIEANDGTRLNAWMSAWTDAATPEGEGAKDILKRATSWLASLTQEDVLLHPGNDLGNDLIIVVSHAGWIRAVLTALFAYPISGMFSIPVDHAHATIVRTTGAESKLVASNISAAELSKNSLNRPI